MKSDEPCLSAAGLSELLETVISRKADFRFRANGFSMAPFIKDGDIVTIAPLSKSAAGVGKVTAFLISASKRLAVHRIVGKNKGFYIIKGDNCQGIGGFVPKERVLGVATTIERREKKVYFGLGPERLLIAFLSRSNLLPFIFGLWKQIPLQARRFIKCRIGL